MPRSRFSQLVALLLFTLGGTAFQSWELAHALDHQSLRHPEIALEALAQAHSGQAYWTGVDSTHQHPYLSKPVSPTGSDRALIWPALPSLPCIPAVTVGHFGSGPCLAREARAGPLPPQPIQPRAPPLS